MLTIYTLFKFLHVAAVIVWLGGIFTLTIFNLRITREQNQAVLLALLKQSDFYGKAVVGPAMALTLIAGIVTAANVGMSFGNLWITWGFVAILLSILLGITLIRRTTGQLNKLAAVAAPGEPRLLTLQRQLGALNMLNVLIVLSAVGAMVLKPTL